MDIFLWALMSAMCIMLLVIDRIRQKDLAKVISAHKDLCSTYEDHIQILREIIMEQENMTTNTEHRRRETDRLGPYVQQVALDNANARIAELEAIISKPLIHAIFAGNGNIIQWDYVDMVLGSSFIENTSAKHGRPVTALAVVPFTSIAANNGYGCQPAEKQGE